MKISNRARIHIVDSAIAGNIRLWLIQNRTNLDKGQPSFGLLISRFDGDMPRELWKGYWLTLELARDNFDHYLSQLRGV